MAVWMVIVYAYEDDGDTLTVITVHDGRSARAPRPL
jgi:hypothetical protein